LTNPNHVKQKKESIEEEVFITILHNHLCTFLRDKKNHYSTSDVYSVDVKEFIKKGLEQVFEKAQKAVEGTLLTHTRDNPQILRLVFVKRKSIFDGNHISTTIFVWYYLFYLNVTHVGIFWF